MFITASLATRLVDAYAYVVVLFLMEDTCMSTEDSLDHASKDPREGSTQRLQEHTRRGVAWEAPLTSSR